MTATTKHTPASYDGAVAILAEDHAGRTLYGARDGVTPNGVGLVAELFGLDVDVVTRDYQAAARTQFPSAF